MKKILFVFFIFLLLISIITICTTPESDDNGGGSSNSSALSDSAGSISSSSVSSSTVSSSSVSSAASFYSESYEPYLIIQESEPGFCAMTGAIETAQGGWTGTGYVNTSGGLTESITWSVNAPAAGTYSIAWRYSFGGTSTNYRDAKLVVNGTTTVSFINFPFTGAWSTWQITTPVDVTLSEGYNQLRLEATLSSGLANIDNLRFYTDGLTPTGCTPTYILSVNSNNPAGGTVSYDPVQTYYDEGSSITLTATPNTGYFFQSWSGDVTSANAVHTFNISQNTVATAIFLPNGTVQAAGLIGYATIQDDNGTPYIVTGGSLGSTVTAATLLELQTYLTSSDPLVIQFSGMFEGADAINVASNKTLLGVGSDAYLKGIELKINQARNVIIRNIKISHVIAAGSGTANDAIGINNKSKNIWIDHCEFYSDLLNGEDYYDGLIDIKDECSFITVSNCYFHDHYKVILMASNDQAIADAAARITFYGNYFYNCNSRMPSIRFGKAHVFNNYYLNVASTGVNSRMGAQIRVEGNYFDGVNDPIISDYSLQIGYWDLGPGNTDSNLYFNANWTPGPATSTFTNANIENFLDTCTFDPPYPYTSDTAANTPAKVLANAGVGKL